MAATIGMVLTPALAGCGFKLRGSAQLPFETLYAGFAPTSSLGADFRRLLRVQGTTRLVDRPEAAQGRLDILREVREKEIVGFSSTGRPREYQLRLILGFKLVEVSNGRELIPPNEIVLRREVTTTDTTQLVAKEQEEALIYREMQTDLVQQLLRRIAAVSR